MNNQPPPGYRFHNGQLLLEQEQALIRRELFALFLEHRSQLKVAQILNDRGYRTSQGKSFSGNAVKRSLRCPSAKGEYHGKPCPPIVSAETWQKTQDILAQAKPGRSATSAFTSFVFCHDCQAKIYISNASPKWACTNKACSNRARIPVPELEASVLHSLGSLLQRHAPSFDLNATWETLSLPAKQHLLAALIERITVGHGTLHLAYKIPN